MTISKKSMKWIPWILILPVVIIRGFTTLYPIIVTLKNSLFDVKVLSGVNKFVGLANYVNVFKDPKVYRLFGGFPKCRHPYPLPWNLWLFPWYSMWF